MLQMNVIAYFIIESDCLFPLLPKRSYCDRRKNMQQMKEIAHFIIESDCIFPLLPKFCF